MPATIGLPGSRFVIVASAAGDKSAQRAAAAGEDSAIVYLDYSALPPEVNSGRMYTGPGAGSMLAAASAWQTLGDELRTAATLSESAVGQLISGSWRGPSATAMTVAVGPYTTWLHGAAAAAEQTAGRVGTAAQAYLAARAAVVPPGLITANRTLGSELAATNIFGQNAPAIAEVERGYAEMWAQDVAAMQGYDDAATTAAAGASPPPTPSVDSMTASVSTVTGFSQQAFGVGMGEWSAIANILSNANNGIGLVSFAAENPGGLVEILNPPFIAPAGLGLANLTAKLTEAPASAGLGQAIRVGALSVPQSWAMRPAQIAPGAVVSPGAIPASAAAEALPGEISGRAFGETMLGALVGQGLAGAARSTSRRRTVVPRSPAAG